MTDISTDSLYCRIYDLVRQVPMGYVTTYGEIARQMGCTARTVGFAMAALPAGHDVPWQRVINSQGRVSTRSNGDGSLVQRVLLESEGIDFDDHQRVNLRRSLWRFTEPPQGREVIRSP